VWRADVDAHRDLLAACVGLHVRAVVGELVALAQPHVARRRVHDRARRLQQQLDRTGRVRLLVVIDGVAAHSLVRRARCARWRRHDHAVARGGRKDAGQREEDDGSGRLHLGGEWDDGRFDSGRSVGTSAARVMAASERGRKRRAVARGKKDEVNERGRTTKLTRVEEIRSQRERKKQMHRRQDGASNRCTPASSYTDRAAGPREVAGCRDIEMHSPTASAHPVSAVYPKPRLQCSGSRIPSTAG